MRVRSFPQHCPRSDRWWLAHRPRRWHLAGAAPQCRCSKLQWVLLSFRTLLGCLLQRSGLVLDDGDGDLEDGGDNGAEGVATADEEALGVVAPATSFMFSPPNRAVPPSVRATSKPR